MTERKYWLNITNNYVTVQGPDEKYDNLKLWIPLYTAPKLKPLIKDDLISMAWRDCGNDWNDLNNRNCWIDGYKAGIRAAEKAHGIGDGDE